MTQDDFKKSLGETNLSDEQILALYESLSKLMDQVLDDYFHSKIEVC